VFCVACTDEAADSCVYCWSKSSAIFIQGNAYFFLHPHEAGHQRRFGYLTAFWPKIFNTFLHCHHEFHLCWRWLVLLPFFFAFLPFGLLLLPAFLHFGLFLLHPFLHFGLALFVSGLPLLVFGLLLLLSILPIGFLPLLHFLHPFGLPRRLFICRLFFYSLLLVPLPVLNLVAPPRRFLAPLFPGLTRKH